MNSRLRQMVSRNRLPIRDGQWIDTCNQTTDADYAGTIIAGVNAKNHYYVMVKEINTEDGVARTIKRTYQQTSRANLEHQDSFGATGATDGYRIRKLTPRECFRLMGVGEAEIDMLLSSGISNSQLYKLAGNSIVINCLAAIFRQLFIGNFNTNLKNNKMMYKPFLTKDEAKGFGRSKNRALELLAQRKFNVHNICVGTARKVALCDGDELLHIIPRQAYQEFITPELPLAQ